MATNHGEAETVLPSCELAARRARIRKRVRAPLALFYVGFGVLHLTAAPSFVAITPDWVPHPALVVAFTGVCEILGGVGLMIPITRRVAGFMLALYAVCVFPANIHHALDHVSVPGLPSSWWYHAPRLAFQPVLVWAALFAGGVIDWPWRRAKG
jgi:uncharacterized membrane protein